MHDSNEKKKEKKTLYREKINISHQPNESNEKLNFCWQKIL